ncbi:MAG TPA: antibiotic biosynthesis monooxygenase [Isosphaeraceae bacterium]
MVTVGMYYDVIPEKAPLFTAKFREVIAALGGIAGHKASYLYQRVDDPYSYAILSEWDDEQSFYRFIRSETFKQVTTWGREQVLRGAPRHKIYPRSEEIGRPSAPPDGGPAHP